MNRLLIVLALLAVASPRVVEAHPGGEVICNRLPCVMAPMCPAPKLDLPYCRIPGLDCKRDECLLW